MKLYVGNLSYSTTEDTLRERFSNYGDVVFVRVNIDRFTGQSKGFGFVEMATDIMGERAIGGMNGKDVDGRRIRVTVAVDKSELDGTARNRSESDSYDRFGGNRRFDRNSRRFSDRSRRFDGNRRFRDDYPSDDEY